MVTPEELTSYCKSKLAKFEVPKAIELMENIPTGATGKIYKKGLKEILLEKWQKGL